jgi:hypothetical protein
LLLKQVYHFGKRSLISNSAKRGYKSFCLAQISKTMALCFSSSH